MLATPITDDRIIKAIALALLKDRYETTAPADALDLARKLHARVVSLGFTPDEATQFASAMLDDKIKAAIADSAKTTSASATRSNLDAKLDELLRVGGELIDILFKKPDKG
jgi:hypothetical protein